MKKDEKYNFIILLGKYLHTYGIPSYQIQSYLSEVAKKLGLKGTFMDSPTWINYVFYDDDHQAQSYNFYRSEIIPKIGIILCVPAL